jgi:beta-glucosidase
MSKSPLVLLALAAALTAQFGPPPAKPKGPWMNPALSPDERASLLVKQLTLDEKISLVHGTGWGALFGEMPSHSVGGAGFVPGIPRLGIPDLQIADAATGVARGAVFGRYSTPLPSGVSEAASWNLAIAREYGALIGRELHDQGYNMGLGGGVNLTREPRNGRNFEYKGEDPILAGKMVGAEMKALGEQGVITHIKHYAINDQENGRNFVNMKIDRRAMRESDLLAFEIGIKEGGIGAVMCSYNMVNGDYACENDYLLNEVLKKQWGFRGFVVSDWGGTHSSTKAVNAGLDMQQPDDTFFGARLKDDVQSGAVSAARLDDMLHRILRTEFAAGLFDRPADRKSPDIFHGLEVAQHVAEEGSVLLKNAGAQLPLSGVGALHRGNRLACRCGSALGRRFRASRSARWKRRAAAPRQPQGGVRRHHLATFFAAEGHPRESATCESGVRFGRRPGAAARDSPKLPTSPSFS